MKAIETKYKGYRFRSRLEARWAVFFDHLSIPYIYEPEGFEKDGLRYLPDFFLPKQKIWVEVKGVLSNSDADTMGKMLDFESPLPYFDFSHDDPYKGGFLVLGEIPDGNNFVYHKIITHHKGLFIGMASFQRLMNSSRFGLVKNREQGFFGPYDGYNGECVVYRVFEPENSVSFNPSFSETVSQAYKAARSARFEYGE